MRKTTVDIPFLDLTRDATLLDELEAAMRSVLRSGRYILGNQVTAFENEVAAYLGTPEAVGVSSGTDALVSALLALGVGPGDEVLCPAYTFVATAEAIVRVGATPVFVDVTESQLNIDREGCARRLTPRTKAIVVVHLFGAPAGMQGLVELAQQADVAVIEDAAQAFGAALGSKKVGTWGQIGCFSFFPGKVLGAVGDGGLVVTQDARLGERIRALRSHGSFERDRHELLGGNFRLDELQAALLRVKLRRVESWLAERRRIDAWYRACLARVAPQVQPLDPSAGVTAANSFVIRVPRLRDALQSYLAERGIQTKVYYPLPVPLQPCFARLASGEAFPVAEAAAREILALPLFPGLAPEELDRVAEGLSSFFERTPRDR